MSENTEKTLLIGDICVINDDPTQLYTYLGAGTLEAMPKPTEIIEVTEEYSIQKVYKPKLIGIPEDAALNKLTVMCSSVA